MSPVEPVELADLMVAVIAGALLVLCGAFYAGALAFARLYRRNDLALLAYVFFAALVGCVFVLADALHLSGTWNVLVGLLLVGYLIAPHLIWKLSVATHEPPADITSPKTT
jgi:drug/metabolite transporter (DMT)-like permease